MLYEWIICKLPLKFPKSVLVYPLILSFQYVLVLDFGHFQCSSPMQCIGFLEMSKVFISNHQADCPFYLSPDTLFDDVKTDSMVIHDTKWPHWGLVSGLFCIAVQSSYDDKNGLNEVLNVVHLTKLLCCRVISYLHSIVFAGGMSETYLP